MFHGSNTEATHAAAVEAAQTLTSTPDDGRTAAGKRPRDDYRDEFARAHRLRGRVTREIVQAIWRAIVVLFSGNRRQRAEQPERQV